MMSFYGERCKQNRNEIIYKANKIYSQFANLEEDRNAIQDLFIDHLCKYPDDSDAWLMLAYLEFTILWKDEYRIINYLENAILFEPQNIQALLFLAYMQYMYFDRMSERLFIMLHYLKTADRDVLSMIEYAKAYYYKDIVGLEVDYEKHLIRSINYCDKHINNFEALGDYYIKKARFAEGVSLLKIALANFTAFGVRTCKNKDATDVNEFFNIFFRGTHRNKSFIDELRKNIEEIEMRLK